VNGVAAPLEWLWEWLQERANPLVVKELRATVRQRRFLVIHFVAVVMLAFPVVAVILSTKTQDMADYRASETGQIIFYTSALVQALLITLLVPGMTAPSLVEEKDKLSWDLLVTTSLSAGQIVLGKLGASLVTVFLMLISWMPLVAVTFLFGGVGLLEVFVLYLQLVAYAVLLAAMSLHSSAVERSSRRAVVYAYFLGLLVGGVCLNAGFGFWVAVYQGRLDLSAGLGSLNLWLGFFGVPAYLFFFFALAFLLNAVNRMKPVSANHSTSIRIFLVTMVLLGSAGCGLAFYRNAGALTSYQQYSLLAVALAPVTVFSLLAACVFATEEPLKFERLRRQRSRLRGWRAPMRLLFPGPGSGAALSVGLAGVLCLAGTAILSLAPGTRLNTDQVAWLGQLTALALATVLLAAGVAYALAVVVKRHTLTRSLLLLLLSVLLFGPVVSLLLRSSRTPLRSPLRSDLWHGDYLSSLVSAAQVGRMKAGLHLRARDIPDSVTVGPYQVPMEALTLLVYTVIGLAGFVVGSVCERRYEAGLPPLAEAAPVGGDCLPGPRGPGG